MSGQIVDFANAPIAGASVGVARFDQTVWKPLGKTDANGRYHFTVRLRPGDYVVIAALATLRLGAQGLSVKRDAPTTFVQNITVAAWSAQTDSVPPAVPPIAELPEAMFEPPLAPPPPPPPPPPPLVTPGEQEFVNVFFATDRAPEGHALAFSSRMPRTDDGVAYGECEVSIPPIHQPGTVERPSIYRLERVEDARKHIMIVPEHSRVFASETVFVDRLHDAFAASGSEALLFVHGYNVDFDDGVRRTAQLFHDLQFSGVPILFSWPGQDAWWRYTAAEDVVDRASRDLAHLILLMLTNEKLTAVNVIAHSLGNRVFARALYRIADKMAGDERFKNVIMAAPDISLTDFDDVIAALKAASLHTVVYSSSADVALQTSSVLHRFPRLGQAPPARVNSLVDTIDASAVPHDLLGHSYFGDSLAVLDDIVEVVMKGMTPEARGLQRRGAPGQTYWAIP